MKTLKISELIEVLTEYKNLLGDIPVFHQTDTEGNSFGTLDKFYSFCYDRNTKEGTVLFIGPYEEGIEI